MPVTGKRNFRHTLTPMDKATSMQKLNSSRAQRLVERMTNAKCATAIGGTSRAMSKDTLKKRSVS